MTVTTVTETADGQTTTETHTVDLTYDASGNPQTITYDGTTYYYTVNIQGDVSGIVDESGTLLVEYFYLGYGTTCYYKVSAGSLSETLVKINPITYRGYVYDKETKLYYLQSRYYNRTSGRFINADAYTSTGQGLLGNNMFAYCGNNPVMFSDALGTFAMSLTAETNADRIPAKGFSAAAGQLLGYVLVTAIACAAAEKALDAEALVKQKEIKINQRKQDQLWNINSNLKNHILKGTKGKHIPGWQKMGIDPNDSNAWALLVPLLKDVIENADDIAYGVAKNGGTLIMYFKTYVEEGVRIMVKLWIDASGAVMELSDAIPQILN